MIEINVECDLPASLRGKKFFDLQDGIDVLAGQARKSIVPSLCDSQAIDENCSLELLCLDDDRIELDIFFFHILYDCQLFIHSQQRFIFSTFDADSSKHSF